MDAKTKGGLSRMNCCKGIIHCRDGFMEPLILHSEDCPHKWTLDLDGNLVCTHQNKTLCPSIAMYPCSICLDCGEHTYGSELEPKVIRRSNE